MRSARADPLELSLLAAHIMALLQDWHLKRWKYKKRKIDVKRYLEALIARIQEVIDR